MRIYKSIDEVQYIPTTALTVGTFDGVHTGHLAIIEQMLSESAQDRYRDLVVTFDPHPRHVVGKETDTKVYLLTDVEERLNRLEAAGVNTVLVLPFDKAFADKTAEEFVVGVLKEKVGIKKIYVGYDHTFGKGRGGSKDTIEELGDMYGFDTRTVPVRKQGKLTVSSTKIRAAIRRGEIEKANQMLGYTYSIKGTVVHGQGLATGLGFPTANFGEIFEYKLMPANGVYLVRTKIDGKHYYGMANCGNRPTIANDPEPVLEANFFDFKGNLYGTKLSVEIISFIRPEKKFDRVEQLIRQVDIDKRHCYEIASEHKKGRPIN